VRHFINAEQLGRTASDALHGEETEQVLPAIFLISSNMAHAGNIAARARPPIAAGTAGATSVEMTADRRRRLTAFANRSRAAYRIPVRQ